MAEQPMIPAQAVEAAARRLWVQHSELIDEERPSWDDAQSLAVWGLYVQDTRDAARELLEAAAPHMLAGAWDEGWDTFAGFDSRPGGPYPANPYRPTP